MIFSPNHVDWPICFWAIHRLGAIASPANPSYTSSELLHQLTVAKAKAIIVHRANAAVALEAAKQYRGFDAARIVVLGDEMDALIKQGLDSKTKHVEPKLKPGEGRTKLAVLSFSSGTTGKPKVRIFVVRAVLATDQCF